MKGKFNILLIEDNPADARLIDIYLSEAYDDSVYTLTVANTLKIGLEFIPAQEFDVILLDLTLPDSFGLDTFKKVYESAHETPVIVLTGLVDEKVGLSAMKLGAQDFLIKGKVKGKGLRRSINYAIERSKLVNELSEKTENLQEKTSDLLKEKAKLSEAQKLAHIGSWEWDIEKGVVTCSDEFYNIYGLNSKDVSGTTYNKLLTYVHSEDRELVKNTIEESYRTHQPFNFYHRILRSNNETRIIHARGEVLKNDLGVPIMMLGTGQDVTERMQEEEMERLATAATKSFNSVIIANKDGNIDWVNEGFTKLSNYTFDEIKSKQKTIFDLIGSSKFPKDFFINESIKNKKPISFERENFSKDGKKYWVITTITPVIGKDGKTDRIIAIDSDITLRKQIEEELLAANEVAEQSLKKKNEALEELTKAKEQLEELMKVKEQFLANMSHEIRTPMNAIIGFTNLILKSELSQEQKQYIDAIKTSGTNLIVIINDILDFSKIQSGKISFEHISFDLRQLISTLNELMLPKSMEKNIILSAKIDAKIPAQLIGDPTRLNQIVLNLVGNAIKFTEKGGVKIQADFVKEDHNSIELKFSVTDTGIGIPEDKLQYIFEGFTQATNDTTRKYGGTGLGLTIVKQLVELQGGSISVKSEAGSGSTFIFNLTFKKATKTESIKNDSPDDKISLPHVEKLNILLVEDNTFNKILAKKVITNWNWDVDTADNGLIAVEKVKEKEYDLVLMDIQMPEMDGYEAARHIRKGVNPSKRDIPIIAMTAHAISGEDEKCYKAGMNDYISKPFDEKVLYDKILSVYIKNKSHRKINKIIDENGKE